MRIFISYSHQDKPTVDLITNRLKQAGHEVWIDHLKLRPGDNISRKGTSKNLLRGHLLHLRASLCTSIAACLGVISAPLATVFRNPRKIHEGIGSADAILLTEYQ